MSITVVRESVDYCSVLNRQIDRCAELGTNVWLEGDKTARARLKAFIGCVWQLYYMVLPVTHRTRIPDYGEVLRKLLVLREEKLLEAWESTNKVFQELIRALHLEGLLVRVSTLGVEA